MAVQSTIYGERDFWPLTHIDELVDMYNEGQSMGAIGNKFGRTRNAVAGQIMRIRARGSHELAPKRGSEGQPKREVKCKVASIVPVVPRRNKPFIVAKPPTPKPRIRLRMIESNTAVTLQELEPHHCRWPLGDPRQSDFRFCGCSRVNSKAHTPYCAEHTVMAGRHYEKPAE